MSKAGKVVLVPGDYDQLYHFIADGVWDAAPLETNCRFKPTRSSAAKIVLVIDDAAMPPRQLPL